MDWSPTGEWNFGSHAFDVTVRNADSYGGLRFDFMQAVTDVSLLAYDAGCDSVCSCERGLEYALFDSAGNRIGPLGLDIGTFLRINIPDTPGMATMIIGGI